MLRRILPYKINSILFGDRKKFGTKAIEDDLEWKKYIKHSAEIHKIYKKNKVFNFIDNMGYKILKKYSLNNKNVLEIGAGFLPHLSFWKGLPNEYIVVDVRREFLDYAKEKLGKNYKPILLNNRNETPDIKENSVDIVFSFYSLEHLQELDNSLSFCHKILKPGGLLIGAIPNEGGILWGVGRVFTSQRSFSKMGFNYNKIISWEHPNFCDEIIKKIENTYFKRIELRHHPLSFLKNYDLNLITSFVYKKKH